MQKNTVDFTQNPEVLKEAFDILSATYNHCWTVYKPFTITNNKITVTADSYFDPVLTLLKLQDRGVINASVGWAGSEQDKIEIGGCDIDCLKAIFLNNSDEVTYQNVERKLNALGYAEPKEESSNSPIILVEGDSEKIIPNEVWQAYWKTKGKKGPESGWEIPTSAEIYDTLRLFNNKKVADNNKQEQEEPTPSKRFS